MITNINDALIYTNKTNALLAEEMFGRNSVEKLTQIQSLEYFEKNPTKKIITSEINGKTFYRTWLTFDEYVQEFGYGFWDIEGTWRYVVSTREKQENLYVKNSDFLKLSKKGFYATMFLSEDKQETVIVSDEFVPYSNNDSLEIVIRNSKYFPKHDYVEAA